MLSALKDATEALAAVNRKPPKWLHIGISLAALLAVWVSLKALFWSL